MRIKAPCAVCGETVISGNIPPEIAKRVRAVTCAKCTAKLRAEGKLPPKAA